MPAVESPAGIALQALRGLIEVHTRALDEDLPGALQEVVEQVAWVLDVRAVAINLLRPAWDDFEIAAIHAPPEIVSALRGQAVPRPTIERLLDADPPALGEVSASSGVSCAPDDGWTRDERVEAADRRLYDDKRRRRIRVVQDESRTT